MRAVPSRDRYEGTAEVLKGHLGLRDRIEVADEADMVLLAMHSKDVVEVKV